MSIDVYDQASYDALQRKLIPLWRSIERLNTDEQTIVVVPSAEVDIELTAAEMQAYEERYLFLLLLLRQPRARMIYLTGQAIHPDIIDYYLDLMPGVISSHARRRLHLLSPMEATFRPLTHKILERPRLIGRIRSLIIDPERAHLVPFMTTWADRELAMRLGIPMYGADPKDAVLGTKSAGRKLFAEVGVPHPAGREDLRTKDDAAAAIIDMRSENPGLRAVVVKHNEGVSGFGNTKVDLDGLPPVRDAGEGAAVLQRLDRVTTELPGATSAQYFGTLEKEGGIVEELVDGDEIRSPSVQLRVTPLGAVELLSTHDQMLGGASGQVFLGSRFPADPGYATLISDHALAVGRRLAELGVIGRFALDFVVARDDGGAWDTHRAQPAQGRHDASLPHVAVPHRRCVRRRDGLRTLSPQDLLDIALMRGLHFDQARQVGSVFHMMSALPAHGRLGVTSVGDSPDDAEERYESVVAVLIEEAGGAGG